MSTVTVLGLGRVGFRTLKLLLELLPQHNFNAVDANPEAKALVEKLERVSFYTYSQEALARLLKTTDLFVTALPSSRAFNILRTISEGCVDVVDVSFTREDPYLLEPIVEKCGTVFVPDAGFAPGYSNLVAGYSAQILKGLEKIDIMVGGIPEKPVPPLGYVVTWNPLDLIEEYLRPARIVRDGELVAVDPLSEIVTVEIEGVGRLEGFVSDGLRTLIRNVKASSMREITLRWPGHISSMKLLRELGLMSHETVKVDDCEVQPVKLLSKLFELKLKGEVRDIAILHVEAFNSSGKKYVETAILHGTLEDPATPYFTALVHAYSAFLVSKGKVKSGVQPLENLWEFKNEFTKYLEDKRVLVKIAVKQ
ncbi:MAG: saccharopine dehydrogenase C-terminal domain-containing protein [Thermosphaera sp.]